MQKIKEFYVVFVNNSFTEDYPQFILKIAKKNMNIIKLSQIWNAEPDEDESVYITCDFVKDLRIIYELEYKRSFLRLSPFKGTERRKNNILRQIDAVLIEKIKNVEKVLLDVLEKWLSYHAITEPNRWAEARVESDQDVYGEDLKTAFEDLASEFVKYNEKFISSEDYLKKIQRAMEMLLLESKNLEFMEQVKEENLDAYIDWNLSEVNNGSLEDINMTFGKNFENEAEAEEFIRNLSVEDIDLESLLPIYDIDSFLAYIEEMGLGTQMLEEMYKKFVFPLWYDKWSKEGIDKTREAIEKIYKLLSESSFDDISSYIANLNLAINAMHQTGAMSDYIQQELEQAGEEVDLVEALNYLSTDLPEGKWRRQLKEIGVDF